MKCSRNNNCGGKSYVSRSYLFEGSSAVPFATGGVVTTVGLDTVLTFLSSGTLTVNRSGNVWHLVQAGGGGAAGSLAAELNGIAGAGAGGFREGTGFFIPAGIYPITVGLGGLGGAAGANIGTKGGDSIFSTITAEGGGFSRPAAGSGGAGGSGGGSCGFYGSAGGLGTVGQGNNGGIGRVASPYDGGGGGGAGGVGQSGALGGAGGIGIASSISGSSVYYGGGGGGGGSSVGAGFHLGGLGGGGNGTLNGAGGNGVNNTGGGGGGGSYVTAAGGKGGDGIVIIRFLTAQ